MQIEIWQGEIWRKNLQKKYNNSTWEKEKLKTRVNFSYKLI